MRLSSRLRVAVALSASIIAATTVTAVAHPNHNDNGFDFVAEAVSPGGVPQERMSDLNCENGKAGIFGCKNVNLASFLPLSELGGSIWANDIWGWTDPQTSKEYALVKLFEGTAFVDITNASKPVYLGTLPTPAPNRRDTGHQWGDVKTYRNVAYIGAEAAGHGVQIFDLTRLRGVTTARTWTQNGRISGISNSHNIAINEDSGTMYVVGASKRVRERGCTRVGGGPVMYDLSNPLSPTLSGCFGSDGYTHDIQCVTYKGPDAQYRGREICVASNEDTVTVLDATDPKATKLVARVPYETSAYTHQGWFTEDQGYFLLDDELDEVEGKVNETTTYIFDMRDLDAPKLTGTHGNGNRAIDHNLFIRDGLAFKSNYTSGLRIDDTSAVSQARLSEVAFFDTFPANDNTVFAGTWGNYPFFPSGVVAVTGTEEGLFLVKTTVKAGGGQ